MFFLDLLLDFPEAGEMLHPQGMKEGVLKNPLAGLQQPLHPLGIQQGLAVEKGHTVK